LRKARGNSGSKTEYPACCCSYDAYLVAGIEKVVVANMITISGCLECGLMVNYAPLKLFIADHRVTFDVKLVEQLVSPVIHLSRLLWVVEIGNDEIPTFSCERKHSSPIMFPGLLLCFSQDGHVVCKNEGSAPYVLAITRQADVDATTVNRVSRLWPNLHGRVSCSDQPVAFVSLLSYKYIHVHIQSLSSTHISESTIPCPSSTRSHTIFASLAFGFSTGIMGICIG
jgi:hypothetical protein